MQRRFLVQRVKARLLRRSLSADSLRENGQNLPNHDRWGQGTSVKRFLRPGQKNAVSGAGHCRIGKIPLLQHPQFKGFRYFQSCGKKLFSLPLRQNTIPAHRGREHILVRTDDKHILGGVRTDSIRSADHNRIQSLWDLPQIGC